MANVPHAFTGVADGDFRPGRSDAPARLVHALGGTGPLRIVSQVHGATVVPVAEADGHTRADAIISDDPAAVIAVRVADCVPILLAGPGVVAAVHAGWRSTAADIVRITVARMTQTAGVAPHELRALIGPAIGACCYEVGDEVRDGVGAVAPGTAWRVGRSVDLRSANLAILRELGVGAAVVGPCTRCDAGYWSHRRDPQGAGRQVGAIRCA